MSQVESVSSFNDQAAGLRQWADAHTDDAERESGHDESRQSSRVLMVVGLPGNDTAPVQHLLSAWSKQGLRWVGDPLAWRVVPMAADDRHLAILAKQQQRWALWIEPGSDAFRRAYRQLKQLQAHQGPHCLLLLHAGITSRRGLLDNLQAAAGSFLGMQLIVLDEMLGIGSTGRG